MAAVVCRSRTRRLCYQLQGFVQAVVERNSQSSFVRLTCTAAFTLQAAHGMVAVFQPLRSAVSHAADGVDAMFQRIRSAVSGQDVTNSCLLPVHISRTADIPPYICVES